MNSILPLNDIEHLQAPEFVNSTQQLEESFDNPSTETQNHNSLSDTADTTIDWQDIDTSLLPDITDSTSANTGEFGNLQLPVDTWNVPGLDADTSETPNIIDEFYIKNGAHRSPNPCTYCRRFRLQCLILRTTEANPNPRPSCSSCVALFRECSLAGWRKRDPSKYETAQPVVGQLHGISEDGISFGLDNVSVQQPENSSLAINESKQPENPSLDIHASKISSKRSNTRSVKKTRVLRNWFACHLDNPYPSDEQKTNLAKQSGLSRTQVVNWFANTRRRNRMSSRAQYNNSKVFRAGSPMPQPLSENMSPMERWRCSPPDQEPASASAIERAMNTPLPISDAYDSADFGNSDGFASSTSGDSFLYSNSVLQDASSNSGSSCYSRRSNTAFSHSGRSSVDGTARSLSRGRRLKPNDQQHPFQCTFCKQGFKKKYDWIRHERSVHLPGLDSWICAVPLAKGEASVIWRVNKTGPECVFCGDTSPTDEHVLSHEFEMCLERPVGERTFTRKDHLWQHLYKFHGCRKWEGWKPNLNLLQHSRDAVRSRCGFCQVWLESWDERGQHLAGHFRSGLTMDDWAGGPGIENVLDE